MNPAELKKLRDKQNKQLGELAQDYKNMAKANGGVHLRGWLDSLYEVEITKTRTKDRDESHWHAGVAEGVAQVIQHIDTLISK